MVNLKTKKVKTENKEYEEVKKIEYAYTKKSKKVLCILLNDNHTTEWLMKRRIVRRFSHNKSTYYILPDGMYISRTGVICVVYMEGISTPMSHKNIDKETKTVEIYNPETQKKENRKVTTIKGLKFDSKLIDMLLNRDLFAEFTKTKLDLPTTITALLLIIITILNIVNIIMTVVT